MSESGLTASGPPSVGKVLNLLMAAFALLMAASVIGNPPFAAPDEPAQFLRAVSLAGGRFGERPTYAQPPATFQEAWFRRITRTVDVPARLVPPGQLPCFAFRPTLTAACRVEGTPFALPATERLALDARLGFPEMIARLDAVSVDGNTVLRPTSYQAAYPPLPLLLPGAAARLGWSPGSAVILGRAAAEFCCIALIGLGWVLLLRARGPTGPRLVGGLLALTPMAVFVTSTFSASGIEIAAGFAWTCGLVAITRERPPASGRVVIGVGLAGAVLTSARQFGPLWLVLTVAVVMLSPGASRLGAVWRQRRRPALVALSLVVAGALFAAAWNVVVFPAAPARTLPTSTAGRVGQAVLDLGRLSRELVGVFGWLDTTPPLVVHLGWGALVCSLVAVACLVGRRGDRRVLALLGTALLVAALVGSWVAYGIEAGAQGRWLLPVAVAVPVVAGEIVARRWSSVALAVPTGSIVTAAALVAAAHVTCLWANARRYAVGTHGPLMFLGRSQWHPAGGWAVAWIAAMLAAGLLVAAALAAVAHDRAARPPADAAS